MQEKSSVYYIRSSALTGFPELCKRHHLNPIKLLAKEGLTPSVLRSQELNVPYDGFIRVLGLAAKEANFPLFSLALSQRYGIEALGPLGLLASHCPTVEESIRTIQKYIAFYAQGIVSELEFNQSEAIFSVATVIEKIDKVPLIELGVGRALSVLRSLLPAECRPSRIHFMHQPRTLIADYDTLLGINVRFGQNENAVIVPKAYLSKAPKPASDKVRDYFESFMDGVGRNTERPFKQQVTTLIRELIPTGDANATTVSKLLGMHQRRLQRELNTIETDFRSLLEEVRYDLARERLEDTDVSLTDLALQLGYSELSAFSRAFKRWSGLSPQEWRDQQHQMLQNAPIEAK